MASLSEVRVPFPAKETIEQLSHLSGEELGALQQLLQEADDVTSIDAFGTLLRTHFDAAADIDLDELISTFLAMAALRSSHGFEAGELARMVVNSSDVPEDSDSESLVGVVTAALASPGLRGLSKAIDISREHDRLLHLSRIVTDVRPVFGDDPSAPPLGALITHTLRLDFFQDGRVHALSFALDNDDLESLGEAVARAQAKSATLQETLGRVPMRLFTLTGEADD